MGRHGITARLFVAMLGVTLVAVLAMVVATQYTFQDDFLDYARERQQERVVSLAGRLGDYYIETGGWAALKSPGAWREMLRESPWRLPPPDKRPHDNRRPHHGPPGTFGLRPTLLNAAGEPVTGPELGKGDEEKVAIRAGGETVGWLAYRPVERITDRIALRFRDQQFEAAWVTAGAVSVLAGMVSLLMARWLLAPVARVAGATRALAAGHFDARVQDSRRDELGQLARDFNRLAESLERNERLRREFMADVSHELRTPLSVLRAELEAIEDGVRAFNHESLAGLQRNLAALNKLVDDLYDLSLADAGALSYRMTRLDVGQLASRIAEQWRGGCADAGLDLDLALPRQPVMVCGDEQRLEQLVTNLLRNSLQYTEAGGCVRVALAIEHGHAVLRIEDSAPGVNASQRERLFERLYRVEGSRSRTSGGAGLGLAICERIARAHEGDLAAYDSPLGGLGVRLRLPLDHKRASVIPEART